ncbi:MAG: NUDIX hydrolase [Alphaproteobacteria bacterium]|nr:NUDIX hydrolase [Alphaproteobacteria bacterium]MDP6564285.1 NUDIX hydrolase [Alphaproteobacteria bacterium]MDP6811848.1 NUDIX hydrolase [Alphaproteobacteria bacterium]
MNNGPINSYPFGREVPDGDNRERHVCGDCGWIHYVNPKIVVGAVVIWEDKVLLCKRAIEPRLGYWTVPAGFMEEGESTADGAARESWEEARARIEIDALIGIYNIPRISQVHMMYRARLLGPDFGVGEESLEVELVAWGDIPWSDLAFPSVVWALQHFDQTRDQRHFQPFDNPDLDRHR